MADDNKIECINADETCKGEVQYHAYGGRLKSSPRCNHHHQMRVQTQQGIEARYPTHAPADFDPAFCGERWDDDY